MFFFYVDPLCEMYGLVANILMKICCIMYSYIFKVYSNYVYNIFVKIFL